jgi:hypothetical protein
LKNAWRWGWLSLGWSKWRILVQNLKRLSLSSSGQCAPGTLLVLPQSSLAYLTLSPQNSPRWFSSCRSCFSVCSVKVHRVSKCSKPIHIVPAIWPLPLQRYALCSASWRRMLTCTSCCKRHSCPWLGFISGRAQGKWIQSISSSSPSLQDHLLQSSVLSYWNSYSLQVPIIPPIPCSLMPKMGRGSLSWLALGCIPILFVSLYPACILWCSAFIKSFKLPRLSVIKNTILGLNRYFIINMWKSKNIKYIT